MINNNADVKEAYSSPEIKTSENIVQNLPLKLLIPMDLSVRLEINETEIKELAESIKTHGVLEPLLVRRAPEGRFEIVCGTRRFMAAQKAELDTVPCVIIAMDDREAMEATLVENMEREDLSDYEVGRWLKLLIEKFPDAYGNMRNFADRFGYKSHATVSLLISHYEFIEKLKKTLPTMLVTRVTNIPEKVVREIRRAPEECQPKLVEYASKYGRSARDVAGIVDVLLQTPEELQEKVLTVVVEKDLNTRETAELVKVFSAHKVIIKPEEAKPIEETLEELELLEEPKKPSEGAVTVPEAPQPPTPPKPVEVKPPTPSLEQIRAVAEDIKAKRLQQKYDNAGQIYILLANYYPQSIIDFFTEHVELESTTPEKAVALMKDIIDEMCNRFTNYGRKREMVDDIFKEVVKWHR
ncbi:MAG: ParB/RepB/Spo0J family partition protein [Candidatus Norongarragalinales archaeon]